MMAAAGLNTVRTYSTPPEDVLELAEEAGLRLLVGLYYEDWRSVPQTRRHARRRILDAGRRALECAMERCAGRDSVLAIAVGNEVPADLVRLHGLGAVEETLSRLVEEVHEADADMLATYCNYPTTEYLHVEGQDIVCFNVFLERPEQLPPYLRHLQVVSGDLLLLATELGLASELHGELSQAHSLDCQVREVDECGCAGATVFSWTDDWVVARYPLEGWGFELTRRDRSPKPALEAVADGPNAIWPVCGPGGPQSPSWSAATTWRRTLIAASPRWWPATPSAGGHLLRRRLHRRIPRLARQHPVKVIELPHQGLAATRNAGLKAASGEIVAYLDADAECHPEWHYHLALSLEHAEVAATGGPNLRFQDVGLVERAVAVAPGGPLHLLLTDDRPEHVPGCNMAVRRTALEEIGRSHEPFMAADDDVDVCWRLLDRGHKIAFAPAAQVRHHPRSTLRAYRRQQRTYGASERMVCGCHTHRFNRLGQSRWAGFIYGFPRLLPGLLRPVVYHGTVGSAPYQGVLRRPPESVIPISLALLPLMVPPVVLGLGLAAGWRPCLAISAPAAALLVAFGAAMALVVRPDRREPSRLAFRLVVGLLYVAQPLTRIWGRLRARPLAPLRSAKPWSGARLSWLAEVERELARLGCSYRRASPLESFDLEVSLVGLAVCRVTTAVVWSWLPRFRVVVPPGCLVLPVAAAGAFVGLARRLLGAAVLATAAAAAAVEAVLLWHLVRQVVVQTSRGTR